MTTDKKLSIRFKLQVKWYVAKPVEKVWWLFCAKSLLFSSWSNDNLHGEEIGLKEKKKYIIYAVCVCTAFGVNLRFHPVVICVRRMRNSLAIYIFYRLRKSRHDGIFHCTSMATHMYLQFLSICCDSMLAEAICFSVYLRVRVIFGEEEEGGGEQKNAE